MKVKNVIVTVDTEGHAGEDPVRHLIMGETKNGELYGIPKIMDICDEYGVKALFFVDFAAAWDYGKDKIEDVVKYILNRGHDVGVHIHPDHMADRKRLFLYEYSKEEQREIIKKCTNLYIEIVGEKPKAFRAGKYGLNYDTLDILAECGYKADFSAFYKSKWCGLNPPLTVNRSVRLDNGIIEFPVTVYGNYFPGIFDRVDKLDVNSSLAEHTWVLSQLARQKDIDTISLFVHSFSFLKWRQDVNCPRADENIVRILKKGMDIVEKSTQMQFCDLDELLELNYISTDCNDMKLFSFSGVRAFKYYVQKAILVLKNRYYSFKYGETL